MGRLIGNVNLTTCQTGKRKIAAQAPWLGLLFSLRLKVLLPTGLEGRSGQPGEFYAVHSIATDSKGNIYTTETYRGQRVQKFVYKGLGPVTKKDQGVVWPNK